MPSAVVILNESQRFELESLPEGFVVLRRMSYGEHLKRKSMTTMSIASGMSKKDVQGTLHVANEEVTLYEFAKCVVEHNLEDSDGRLLNLSMKSDLQKLHPKIGQEIEKYISQMNDLDDQDEDNPEGN